MRFFLGSLCLAAFPTFHGERLQDGVADVVSVKRHQAEPTCEDLDEECYTARKEAGIQNKDRSYVLHLAELICTRDGYTVKDQTAFKAFIRYFDGECKTASLAALELGLEAALSQTCGGTWLEGSGTSLGQIVTDEKSLVHAEAVRAATVAMHKVSSEMAARAAATAQQARAQLRQFIQTMLKVHDLTVTNQDELTNLVNTADALDGLTYKNLQDLMTNEKVKLITGQDDQGFDDEVASLSQSTYETAAADDDKMAVFIHQVMDQEELLVTNYGGLFGITPWYSDTCGQQSYSRLKEELHECVGGLEGFKCGDWLEVQ